MKNDNGGFNIFEATRKGARGSVISKNSDKPLIFISTLIATLTESSKIKVQLEKDSKCVFAEKGGVNYFAVLPLDSKVFGYKTVSMKHSKNIYVPTKKAVSDGLNVGLYEICDPVFSGNIDWYELNPVDIEDYE